MFKRSILILLALALKSISCMSLEKPGIIALENRANWDKIIDEYIFPSKPLNESLILPNAANVYRYDNTSEVVKSAIFYSNLCKTSNCRASLDKWDCENCATTLPDGVVARSFQTYPLGVTGEVIISEK